jgi:uncharacterized protein YndB with AHSA1/START domain
MSITAQLPLRSEFVEIAITRIVDAAPDKVFDAWLCGEILSRWWGPRDGRIDFSAPRVEAEPVPGGTFRTCIRSPRGEEYWARGFYLEIEPPEHLAFTYGWEDEHGEVFEERVVNVDLAETEGKTRLAFHISGYDSRASRDSEIEGWHECLDRLVQYFAGDNKSFAVRRCRIFTLLFD